MTKPSTLAARSTGVLLLLFLVLVLLKQAGLTRVAHWSWWAVSAPLWGIWALALLLVVLGMLWVILVAALRKSAR